MMPLDTLRAPPRSALARPLPPEAAADAVTARGQAITRMFAILAVTMIFLQKFGYTARPFDISPSFGLNTLLMWGGLGWLTMRGYAQVSASRLVLLVLLVMAMFISMIAGSSWPNITSFGILLLMYGSAVVRVPVSAETARRCFNVFQVGMVVVALIVLGQQIVQYTVGHAYWPDLDRIVSPYLIYPGFAYHRPYSFQSPYDEPNGIVFLEPSALSFYLGIAIGIELVWFRKPRLLLYVAGMFACLAGTGPLALALTTPFWIVTLGRRACLVLLVASMPFAAVGLATGAFETMFARSGELSNTNSSGYARIMVPLQSIAAEFERPSSLLTGLGPGTSAKALNVSPWPFSKIFHEYGLLAAILFHLFLTVCMFDGPPIAVVSLIILLPEFFFGGGFVSHAHVMPLVLFGSLLRIEQCSPPVLRAFQTAGDKL